MGVAFSDFDRDGYVDIFVVDMLARSRRQRLQQMPAYTGPPSLIGEISDRPQENRNTLLHNRGDGTFEEIAYFAGLSASGWSWQPILLDVDLDGYPDIITSSGHTKSVQDFDANEALDAKRPHWQKTNGMFNVNGTLIPFQKAVTAQRLLELPQYPRMDSPFYAFRNSHNLTFEDKTSQWGLTQKAIRRGVALVDLDDDGDLDLVVNPLNSEPELWINQESAPRIAVELRGKSPNTGGVGAKVTLRNGAVPVQTDEVTVGGKFLSSSQPRLVFAAGASTTNISLEIIWRSGKRTSITRVFPNRIYEAHEEFSE